MKQQDYQEFFASKLGIFTKNKISNKLVSFVPNFKNQKVLIVGNGTLYLENSQDIKQIKQIDENTKIEDNYYDIVILSHFLEFQNKDNFIIRKIWQSLKDNGKLITITPNRHGLWFYLGQHIFRTPKAYSAYQITKLLDSNLLITNRVETALFFPPLQKLKLKDEWVEKIDKILSIIACKNGGIIISSAVKKVYAPILKDNKKQISTQYATINE